MIGRKYAPGFQRKKIPIWSLRGAQSVKRSSKCPWRIYEIHISNFIFIHLFIYKLIYLFIFDLLECRYPLRNELIFQSRKICTVRYGIETAAFVGSRIWTNLHNELKKSTSLNEFESKIKTWKPCKIYLLRIGYLQVTDSHMLTDVIIYVSLFFCLSFSYLFLNFFYSSLILKLT